MKMNENLREGEWIMKKTMGKLSHASPPMSQRVNLSEWQELARIGS